MSKQPVNKQSAIDAWATALQAANTYPNRIKVGVWRLQFGSDSNKSPDRQGFLQASVAENDTKPEKVIDRPGGLQSALGSSDFENPWTQMLGWGSDEKLETSPMRLVSTRRYLLSFSRKPPSNDIHELVIRVQKPEQDTKASAGGKKSFMSRLSENMSLRLSSHSGPSGTSNSFTYSGTADQEEEEEGHLGEVAGHSVLQGSDIQRRLSVNSKEIEQHTGDTDSETSSNGGH